MAIFLFFLLICQEMKGMSALIKDEREGHADHEFLDEQVRNASLSFWKRFCSSIRTHFDYPRVSQPRAHIHFLSRIRWLVIAIWWWPSQPLKENMLSPNGWAFIFSSFFLYVGNNMLRHKPTFVKKKEEWKWRIHWHHQLILSSFSFVNCN